MTTKQALPYGAWPSTITSQTLTQGLSQLNEPKLVDGSCYWLESNPENKGRTIIMCKDPSGKIIAVTPRTMNVRTRIHEYGGGSYCIHDNYAYFTNDSDQRIYRCTLPNTLASPDKTVDKRLEGLSSGCNIAGQPEALSPEGAYRYADFCIDEQRQQLICVCEIHKETSQEPENCIVALQLDGSSTSAFKVLISGNDFYSNPRIAPGGDYISWLTWCHPNMPWDASECWLAQISAEGLIHKRVKVAGGEIDIGIETPEDKSITGESIFQPQWSPNGELFFVSDRSNWWNLERYNPSSNTREKIHTMEAEFATPQWVFGMSTYSFLDRVNVFCCYTQNGRWYAAIINLLTYHLKTLDLPYSSMRSVNADDVGASAIFIASDFDQLDSIVRWHDHQLQTIRTSGELAIAASEFSKPLATSFYNDKTQEVHGFYYAPHNSQYTAPSASKPPLLVMCHGGPTGATNSALNLKIQYWTSRGFAVFDINYSGSTGYGRSYRDRLKAQWGLVDVEDICAGAAFISAQGLADPEKLAVRGSSAGGYSVLAALTFKNTFKAGASLYGIGDLSLLASDTHKFESRYLDQLIGPYPETKALYAERSPINSVEQLNCPVIFLQGLEDKVVPPNQAETMVISLYEQGIPVAYVTFKNEGHGFRQADNIQCAIDSEYAFYADVFKLDVSNSQLTTPLLTVPFVDAEMIKSIKANPHRSSHNRDNN